MRQVLAIEGGGTRTTACLYEVTGGAFTLLREASGEATNPVERGVEACVSALGALSRRIACESLDVLAVGISGAGRVEIRSRIAERLFAAVRPRRVLATNDLHPILLANTRGEAGILAIAGTGSSVLAQASSGAYAFVGGRGRVFGDDGSAYQIAVSALRAAADSIDGMGPETRLVAELPTAAGVVSFADLVPWTAVAGKQEVAALAKTVEALATADDAVARQCIAGQASRLAEQVVAASQRLALPPDTRVFVHGALFDRSSLYRTMFAESLAVLSASLTVQTPALRGPRAIAELANLTEPLPDWVSECRDTAVGDIALSPTEQRCVDDLNLDQMSPIEIVRRMNREDVIVASAVGQCAEAIALTIERVAAAIRKGGRLIYVGAGTSGRLGVLDAAECPPTFGVDPDRVVALIAGGETALRRSAEGAEDDQDAARADVAALDPPVGDRDVVIGIAASGRTPYAITAIEEASLHGAATALVCCNPVEPNLADIVISVETGPEVLPGSTRLKAGTATKLVLNMISTGALALAGYVFEGQMVGMRPTNTKLRDRAVRIVSSLTGTEKAAATQLLEKAGGRIGVAVLMSRRGLTATDAAKRLDEAEGILRDAL